MHHLKNLNRTVLHLFLMHKIITWHICEAVAFLGTSPPWWFKRFPKIFLLVLSSCNVAAWTPLTSYCNNPTQSPTHPESMADSASSSFPPRESLVTRTSRGTTQPQILGFLAAFTAAMGMYSLLYSWELESHFWFCQQRENAINLICGHLPLPILPLLVKWGSHPVFSGNIKLRIDMSNSHRKLGIKETEN